jgi:hypothetical protein
MHMHKAHVRVEYFEAQLSPYYTTGQDLEGMILLAVMAPTCDCDLYCHFESTKSAEQSRSSIEGEYEIKI